MTAGLQILPNGGRQNGYYGYYGYGWVLWEERLEAGGVYDWSSRKRSPQQRSICW